MTLARNLVADTAAHAARYRKSDPVTSREAAERVDVELQCNQVLSALRAATKAEAFVTSAELADMMGVDRHLTARRLPDLKKQGLATQWGRNICTVNGTKAVTWKAVC